MGKTTDITGKVFGRLTALRPIKPEGARHLQWVCFCECGNTKNIPTGSLTSGRVNSCGCLFKELIKNNTLAIKAKKDRLENEENFVGTIHVTRKGSAYKILEYINANDILIKFQDDVGYETRITHTQFKTGSIGNPYLPIVNGVGYLGVGPHQATVLSDATKVGNVWTNMLKRCYDPNNNAYHSYGGRGVYVCEEWKCFQTFAEWYVNQTGHEYGNWELDKDILVEDNLVYGPDACALVPKELNSFFKRKWENHATNVVGVHLHKLTGKFFCNLKGKSGKLRVTTQEAEIDYLQMMSQHLLSLVEKYVEILDDCVVKAIIKKKEATDARLRTL